MIEVLKDISWEETTDGELLDMVYEIMSSDRGNAEKLRAIELLLLCAVLGADE